MRVARSHSRDGVAFAGIARVHIAHRGRDRGVAHQLADLNHVDAGRREARSERVSQVVKSEILDAGVADHRSE
jgi:hypothetical protein